MNKAFKWKAILVVALGSGTLLSTPKEATAFACGFAECILTTTCPDMVQFCALHNCSTDLYNCGELFNCSGNRRLHYCGSGPDT